MARPRAADYHAQRDRILARAVEAFAQTGYAGASMAGLAQACGVSKATLYHYYPGKQALLFEALDRYTQRLLAVVGKAAQSRAAPAQILRDTVRALMAEYRHSRAHHIVLLRELRFLSSEQQQQVRAQERAVVAEISALLSRAAPRTIPAEEQSVVTMALLGMINFTFTWLRPEGPVTHDRFADIAASLWLDGLSGLAPNPAEPPHEQAVRIQS
jgi:AcrR family transcriptional regulator